MQLLPVISLIVSMLTLIIIFLLRAEDRKDKSFSRVMDMIGKFRSEADKTGAQLKETSQQASNDINAQASSVYQLMHSIDDKILDLQGRSEDLAKLQAVMTNYRNVLVELSDTTAQAEQKIKQVKEEVAEVQRVENVIAGFQRQIEATKQTIQTDLEDSKAAVTSMEEEGKQKLSSYKDEVTRMMQESQDGINTLTTTLRSEEEQAMVNVRKESDQLQELGKQTETLVDESRARFNQLQADSLSQVNKDLASFSIACSEKLEMVFKQTIEQIDASFLTMVHTSQVFINELDNRLASTKEVAASMDAKSAASLSDVARKLAEYSKQLENTQSINASQESRKKQMEESINAMREETENLHQELLKLKEEKAAIVLDMAGRTQPEIPVNSIRKQKDVSAKEAEEQEVGESIPEEENRDALEAEDKPAEAVEPAQETEEQEAGEPIPEEENREALEAEDKPAEAAEPAQETEEQEDEEPELEDLLTSDIDEETSVTIPRGEEVVIDDSKPLPIHEFESAFVQEDKAPEPVDRPDLSEADGSPKQKAKQDKTVNYVPVGKEEVIHLDDGA